jgi:hypothetical protein
MSRMTRWTFNILMALSLTLLVAVVVLWVRSYPVGDHFMYDRTKMYRIRYSGDQRSVSARYGAVGIRLVRDEVAGREDPRYPFPDRNAPYKYDGLLPAGYAWIRNSPGLTRRSGPYMEPFWRDEAVKSKFNGLGLRFHSERSIRQSVSHTFDLWEWHVVVPYWMIAIPFALLPAYQLAQFWRRGWRRAHLRCPRCGYDLRATPYRCPECGYTPPAGTTAAA